MNEKLSRRQALAAMAVPPALEGTGAAIDPAIIKRHDERVEMLLRSQITDPGHRSCGTLAGPLPAPGGAGSILEGLTTAFVCSDSKFHRDRLLLERIKLAAAYLERAQSPDGNIDLPTTNFNSPPDTGFVAHSVATAACLARRAGEDAIVKLIEPFLTKAAAGMTKGGVHTPNHRWVICSALAQINELFPNRAYLRRIDQWLAEGVDLDEDGQWTERSVLGYNIVCDRAFVVMAAKLRRPELLDPVRRNLNSMLYLLHPDGAVAAEVTRRGVGNPHGRETMDQYWFPLTYLANHDGNGQFATLARRAFPAHATLSAILEYPELLQPGPAPAPLPDNYEKRFTSRKPFVRIRRGDTSVTMLLGGDSRFLSFRRGDASVIVRFANAFFGRSQFIPQSGEKKGDSYYFSQSLEAGYYQPLDPPRRVGIDEWYLVRLGRRQSEVCRLERSATVTETKNGLSIRIRADGTKGSPLAVEINLREGAKFEGCEPIAGPAQSWLLRAGQCTYRAGKFGIRFGPGAAAHEYTDIRGAEPKLPGPSVYLTGFTPFDHTLVFEWV